MSSVQRRNFVAADGVRLSYLMADRSGGQAPLVIFCHGFPGLAYSWRHQLLALAENGYRAVALDMRGYGGSDAPESVSAYSLEHIRSDLLSLLTELNVTEAVFAGHDFGAAVVWYMALAAPEYVRAAIVLSVPYDHDYYGRRGRGNEATELPSKLFARAAQSQFLHAHYFQSPGVAERELEAQCELFLRRIFWALSAKGNLLSAFAQARPDAGYLEVLPPEPESLPWSWLSRGEFSIYADTFSQRGLRGPLSWYRVADINWEINRRFVGVAIQVPVCFMAGQQDPVLVMSGDAALEFMRKRVSDLRECVIIPDAGHWLQQEQVGRVNEIILRFLRSL